MRRQATAEDTDPPADAEDDIKHPKPRLRSHRVAPATGGAVVEKALPNGDIYRGEFAARAPHGYGKYLWADGCMYEGDWRRGKAAGKGKFSWPSGATFEGEFRSGRMDGHGTFTGAAGDTYRGAWVADRKHGFGSKSYSNGDYYEGTWRRNLQDGNGRYVWSNANQYVGEWRGGVIAGRGVLIWANGNRYDGHWENGVPKGSGVFTWPDGSCYVGNWSKDQNQLNGTFYPASSSANLISDTPEEQLQQQLPLKRSSAEEAPGRGSVAEKNFPKICIWDSDGEAGDITCDIVDTLEIYKDSLVAAEPVQRRRGSPCCFRSPQAKKPGQTISKGHKNYDLMLNLQLGIRYSVGRPAATQMRQLRSADFDPKEKFWTRFPPEGSKVTPPHQSVEFRWKDYCPMVFRHLRKLFEVDTADYMLAICGNDALRELSSPGKSGSFFYMTQDDRFMIKTVKKSEVKVLIRMLPSYYQHVCRYKNSLVTKFFGVHCVKPIGGQKVRFIVMGNLFCSEYRIHRRFDLKGSSHGRTTDKAEADIDETTTLKDLDLNFVFRLQKSWFGELIEQIGRDCEFLEAERIMDYSLLVGVHFRDDVAAAKMLASRSNSPPNFDGKTDMFPVGADVLEFRISNFAYQDMDQIMDGCKPLIRLGANMPARVTHVSPSSLLSGETASEVILYFGIIDILQDYDISKKLEHAYKSLQADPASISAVDPKLYSRRFRDFIGRVFVQDD